MILLYRDPKGETIGSTKQAPSVMANPVSQIQPTNFDLEEKVASLEKALSEKEAEIAELMKEKVGTPIISHLVIMIKLIIVFSFRNCLLMGQWYQ